VRISAFEVVADPFARGAEVLAGGILSAITERGGCSIALSRGADLMRHLAACEVAWEVVDVFQADERAAPDGSPDRNLTQIERDLCARIDGPKPRVHAMPVTGDLDEGAVAYASELQSVCGSPPVLDVVHLGLGPDGHTASLVPGDPVLEVRDAPVAVTGLYEGCRRMTLTYPVLDAACLVVFVVAGAAKSEALAAVRRGGDTKPAARIRALDVRFVVDPSTVTDP
jgi:6-phosphogluconolactonase